MKDMDSILKGAIELTEKYEPAFNVPGIRRSFFIGCLLAEFRNLGASFECTMEIHERLSALDRADTQRQYEATRNVLDADHGDPRDTSVDVVRLAEVVS